MTNPFFITVTLKVILKVQHRRNVYVKTVLSTLSYHIRSTVNGHPCKADTCLGRTSIIGCYCTLYKVDTSKADSYSWSRTPIALVCIATLCDWLKISRHFLNQSEVKPKPLATYSYALSRAWHGRRVFASSSDWFIGLFTTVVIGQSNYFGFGFTTLK